jgi:hypothetical protein
MTTIPAPVFIVGVARSGTSALYLSLQKHASFTPTRSRHGFDLTESRVFLDPSSVRHRRGAAWDFLLHDDAAFLTLERQLHGIPRDWDSIYTRAALQRVIFRRAATRLIWWKLCRRDSLTRAYFTQAAAARGVRRLVEKTPDHLYRLPEIRSAFPDARIVCSIRHPLDVFRSYRRRLAAAADVAAADSPVVRWLGSMNAASFVGYYRSIAREATLASRVLIVRYEEFTASPAAVFQRICTFIGEPFDARCVEEPTPALNDFVQDPRLARPIEPNDERWQDFVSHDEATHIEDALREPMQQLGYARRT